jgi:DNA-binding winged helix-turn-helix (wHTH) protein
VAALSTTDILQFDRFHLDRRGLFRREEGAGLALVEVGSRALEVLRVLLERPGELVSRDQIMAAAWPDVVVEDNNLTIQIAALRRVLDQDRANGSCIQTVPRRGYRFIGPVERGPVGLDRRASLGLHNPPRQTEEEGSLGARRGPPIRSPRHCRCPTSRQSRSCPSPI